MKLGFIKRQIARHTSGLAIGLITFSPFCYSHGLTINNAIAVAIKRAPELQSIMAEKKASSNEAIAKGQWKDVVLGLGLMNVPVDSFDFKQEAMTQIQMGFSQELPKYHALKFQKRSLDEKADALYFTYQNEEKSIAKKIRLAWLDLSYFLEKKEILEEKAKLFSHLVEVTESLLANSRILQKDVIRANLELNVTKNEIIAAEEAIEDAKIELTRWLGFDNVKKIKIQKIANWPINEDKNKLEKKLLNHPLLKRDAKLIAKANAKLQLALTDYQPGFKLAGGYGIRQGNNSNGSKRSDFMQFGLYVSSPLFPKNRQDKKLAAKKEQLISETKKRDIDYKNLKKDLDFYYLNYQKSEQKIGLFKSHLLTDANSYANSSLSAYQNTQMDFPTLALSYLQKFQTELQYLMVKKEHTVSAIHLMYLKGA